MDALYAAYCRATSALVKAEIYASRFNASGYSRPGSAPAPPKGRRAMKRHQAAAAAAWAWVRRCHAEVERTCAAYKS